MSGPLSYVMTADPFSISILSAGQGWLIVEKSSGLSVHEEQGQDLCSLLQSRINTDPELRNKIDWDPGFGILPVHRLDRETSGVILLACRPRTFSYFAMQFEHHKVRKRYIALLHGDLPEPTGENGWGLWAWPLSKEAGGRSHPEGRSRAVPSETRFRILRRSAHYTLIECQLLTGRKHQIRRHARLAGHAVVGDARYGTSRSLKFLREETGFIHLALHSFSLQVQVPGAAAPQVFQSPAIPPEILRLLEEDQESEEGTAISIT
ncbi:MAG TPA: RNA pseudouridine synthase [Thermodesulfobacteriota bacterium]|nr:RNA pseudouridine synthase [Thermodesulfobacteriota bacterium]